MTVLSTNQMLDLAEKFGCRLPFAKAEFLELDIPKKVREEFGGALEVVNSYREDFPEELLSALQKLASRGLERIYNDYQRQ